MLQERIIIEPNISKYQAKTGRQRYKTFDELTTDGLIKRVVDMGRGSGQITELLPQNCRVHEKHLNADFYVTEYPPMERSIRIDIDFTSRWAQFVKHCKKNNMEDAIEYYKKQDTKSKARTGYCNNRIFNFVIPFTVIVTEIVPTGNSHSCFIFFRNTPLNKLTDALGKAPFYNIDGNQRACFSVPNRSDFFNLPKYQIVDGLVETYWASHFNSDYTSNMRSYRYRMDVVNYFMWEYLSKTDPLSILKIKWIPMKENLIEFIDKRKRRYMRKSIANPNFAGMKQAFNRSFSI